MMAATQALFTLLILSVLCLLPCQAFIVAPESLKSLSLSSNGGAPSRSTVSATSSTSSATLTDRDVLVQDLLKSARSVGQVGSLASTQDQEMLIQKAKKLVDLSDRNPAKVSLQGVHDLVYSAAPGGSSGRLVGPLYGKVQQTFLEHGIFINSVEFGPLKISLQAKCENKSATVNAVKFETTTISIFGNTLVTKDLTGGGAWKYLFLGEVQDVDGRRKLVRVMETPSLFIIEQPIES
jgi:hypothetical protein